MCLGGTLIAVSSTVQSLVSKSLFTKSAAGLGGKMSCMQLLISLSPWADAHLDMEASGL